MITVRSYGGGSPPVVLLHGGPGAPGHLAPLARELGQSFQVLEPLQRRSGARPLTVAQHVADLAEVALEQALYVGSSWGAMLGLSFAAAHPRQVTGLVLIGCGSYDPQSRESYLRSMEARLTDADVEHFERLRSSLNEASDCDEQDLFFTQLGEMASKAQAYDPIPGASFGERCDYRAYLETWNDVLRLQSEGIEPAAFRVIEAPVLMLHGADDPHPGPSTFETLRACLPQIEYLEFEHCGHLPWLERQARNHFLSVLRRRLRIMAG